MAVHGLALGMKRLILSLTLLLGLHGFSYAQKVFHITVEYSAGSYRALARTASPNVGSMTTPDFEKRFAKEKGMADIIDYMVRNGYELLSALPAKEPAPAVYQLLFFNRKAD